MIKAKKNPLIENMYTKPRRIPPENDISNDNIRKIISTDHKTGMSIIFGRYISILNFTARLSYFPEYYIRSSEVENEMHKFKL